MSMRFLKYRSLIVSVLGMLLSSCSSSPNASSVDFKQAAKPQLSVVIDAGHGGKDPGASYFNNNEKDLNLIFARKLQQRLKAKNIRVWMTRTDDTFVPLKERIELANKLDVDLFVSLHMNANPSNGVSGTEVYYPRETMIGLFAHWPAMIARSEIHSRTPDTRFSLWDLISHQNRHASYEYAQETCRQFRLQLDATCKEKKAGFVVLRESQVPALLLEMGYLSNHSDATKLVDPAYQDRAVDAIVNSILRALRVSS